MKKIGLYRGLLIGLVVCLVLASTSDAQTGRSAIPGPVRTPGPNFGLTSSYPNAGLVVTGPYVPPVNVLYALQYDPLYRWVWAGGEASLISTGQPDLFILDQNNGFQVLSTIVTDELRGPGALQAQIDGPVDEIALLGDGCLLCADYNGDLSRFDDTLFMLDPSNPGVLKGVWYLDDLGCPGSCVANTNTNVPQDRVDAVAGLALRRTYAITASNQASQEIYVSQFLPSALIRQIELTPGTPGTWATRRVYVSPTGDSVDGMDWDPDLQSFWMTSTNTGMIYEVALDTTTNSFRVLQSFLANGTGGAIAIAALRDTVTPHTLVEGEGFSFTGSLNVIDSGHLGRGQPSVYDPAGTGPVQVGILYDQDCVGHDFRLLVSSQTGGIHLGDRYIQLGLDPIFLWSATSPLFAGKLDTSGSGMITLPVSLPPSIGPLYFVVVVFGDPSEDYLGIKRISLTQAHVTQ